MSRLQLKQTRTNAIYVRSLCALSADELLLACGDAGLRALSLHTGELAAREPTVLRYVWRVAFDAHTNMLLIVQPPANTVQLVSLRRNASEWLEVQRLYNTIFDEIPFVHMEVCYSNVLIGSGGKETLYLFDVSAAHTLSYAGSVVHQCYGLACALRNCDTFVAIANLTSVSLQRLASSPQRREHIATSVEFVRGKPLLRGELLLVVDFDGPTNKCVIVSFRETDNVLTERRGLLDDQESGYVTAWTLAGDQLVLAIKNSKSLLVFDIV